MRNDTVVRFRKKDEVFDPLTQLLREGAQRLIHQAVSAELELFLEHHGERRDETGRRAVRTQRLFAATRGVDGDWAGHGTGAEGTRSFGWGCVLSVWVGAAVCAARAQRGGGAAVAVSERHFHGQHAGGADRLAGGASARAFSAGDLTAEGGVDKGI